MKRAKIKKGSYEYKGKTEDKWITEWLDPTTGKRRQKWHPNKRHAEAHASKIDRDTDRGIHEAGSGKKLFGEVWKAWIALCEENHRSTGNPAGNTLANYHWGGQHILPEFEQRQIGKITSIDVERFCLKLRERGSLKDAKPLSPKSVHNIYSYLFKALQYAVRDKRLGLASNPLRDDPVKILDAKPQRDWDIPFEDVEKLIQILHGARPGWWNTITWENHKIAFAFRAFAGLRGGEIAALRWDRINLAGTTFEIDKDKGTVSMVDGLKRPKSKASARTIPMSQYLYDALLEHANETDMKGFVIKNQLDADMHLSSQGVSDMHHDLMVRANLKKPDGNVKFTGHDLRHWHCSTLEAMGLNLTAISKRLGHSDPSITLKMYSHVIKGTEDGLKKDVPPIWHQRLARAEPGQPTMIEGVASESTLVIDGTATRLIETPIPENAYPWVPEALRLLEGGWRVPDVTRHLGQHRTTINAAFHKLGLPNPDAVRKKVRDRMFGELIDAGYTDKQIAQKMNCSEGTVFHWRLTKEAGVPNTRYEFKKLMRKGGGHGKKLTDEQVREVRDRLEAGESFSAIGKRFSVTHGLIGNIKAGRNYRSVKQEREKNGAAQELVKPLKDKEKSHIQEIVSAEKLRESQLKLL